MDNNTESFHVPLLLPPKQPKMGMNSGFQANRANIQTAAILKKG